MRILSFFGVCNRRLQWSELLESYTPWSLIPSLILNKYISYPAPPPLIYFSNTNTVHGQTHPRPAHPALPVPLPPHPGHHRIRSPPRDHPGRHRRVPEHLPLTRFPGGEPPGGGRQGLLRTLPHQRRGADPPQDLLHRPRRGRRMRGPPRNHGRQARGHQQRHPARQHQLLQLRRVLGPPGRGARRHRLPHGAPHPGPQGRRGPRPLPHGPLRHQGETGHQARDQALVPGPRRHRDPPPMAQHRRRLVLREGVGPQGAPLSSVQVQPQTGGRQAGLLPALHAHGLPGQGEQGHPRPPRRRRGGGLDPPHRRTHEPPPGGDRSREKRTGIPRGGGRLRRRRHGVRDPPRGRKDGTGPHRRVGLLHRRYRHSGRPRHMHGGQRPLRGGPHIPGQVQGRDAQDRMLVQAGRDTQNQSRRPRGAGKEEGIEGDDGPGGVLGEDPPAMPIRSSCSTSGGRCPRCTGP